MNSRAETARTSLRGYRSGESVHNYLVVVAPHNNFIILVALVRSDTVSLNEANAILRIMIKRHYRSPIDRLDEFV